MERRPTARVRGRVQDAPRRRRYVPIFQRLAALNALVVLVAVCSTVLVLAPHRLSGLKVDEEAGVLVGALVLIVLVNLLLLERVVRPLRSLSAFARKVDLAHPNERLPDAEPTSEVGELATTFNEMLARLDAERRESTGRVLAGQEAERLRIAQELHDQVGQDLTAVLLSLSRIEPNAPAVASALSEARDAVRASLEDVRRIALELRPEALDDLGLARALAVLCDRFSERSGLDVATQIDEPLPELSQDSELVVYRIAQEALTNVARHSRSARAELRLEVHDDVLSLLVRDWGVGLAAGHVPGSGIRGMRERAALVGSDVELRANSAGVGCELQLDVPLEASQ
jgi:two-component system, NarL family, sensor histidine kinase UhpB